ncbi:hypothetical protein C8R44DRAFT_813541, partial [Mycena epipterygia]
MHLLPHLISPKARRHAAIDAADTVIGPNTAKLRPSHSKGSHASTPTPYIAESPSPRRH